MQQIDVIKIYSKKHCLIIDDMSEIRGSLNRILKTFGAASVDTAATGQQAIELCENKSYDIVLCDYNLGGGQDGQQVLEELRYRRLLRNTNLFVMITAESARDMVLGALEYLPDDYLTKPLTQNVLQARLNRIIIRQEDLYPIKEAIDQRNYEKAIDLCTEKYNGDGKYPGYYQRIKAELLFRLERYPEAEEIYKQALAEKNAVWAKLGLGKTYLANKRYDEAEELLESVVEADERFVEAHDLLAQLHAEQGDFKRSQQSTQRAADISPKSVLRQRRLAQLAKQNKDYEASMSASRKVVRMGPNSCHYSPQDYFDFVSELITFEEEPSQEDRVNRTKEATSILQRVEKKHHDDKSLRFQTMASRSRVYTAQKKEDLAAKTLEQAQASITDRDLANSPYMTLELAQAYKESGNKEKATELLRQVAAQFPDDEDIAARVDILADEPISAQGQQMVAKLTKDGIALFNQGKYKDAIELFERAVALYPNHAGLALNLIQVIISETKENGPQESYGPSCRNALHKIGELTPDHKQYDRYAYFSKQVQKYYPK